MTSGTLLDTGLFSRAASRPLDIAGSVLPPVLRPDATMSVLDISEYVGERTGGVRTYLAEKARFVSERAALRQVVLIPGDEDAIVDGEGVRCYRLRGPAVPFHPAYRFMLATRSTSRIVAHERPHVIEVGSAYFAPWLIFRARRHYRAPLVWFYHANLHRLVAPRGAADALPRRVMASGVVRYTRRIASSVDSTIVASDFARRDLEAIGVENLVHIPLGVDLETFHPLRRVHAEATRREHQLPPGPLAFYVGRLAREKHTDRLAAAWPEVYKRTGATLVLVGDGPLRHRLAGDAAARGIVFLGYTRDRAVIADLLAAADLYVSPGPHETFGLAALEAMASGIPVLSVNAGGVAEQVERNGAGALYDEADPASFLAGAERLLGSDGAAAGARGRLHAESHHSWDAVFTRIFEVYAGLTR